MASQGFRRHFPGLLLFVLLLLINGCASRAALAPGQQVSVYSTAALGGGIRGGREARDVAATLNTLLEKRRDQAEPDGALGAAASRALAQASAGGSFDSAFIEEAARELGFVGNVWTSGAMPLSPDLPALIEQMIAGLPDNVLVTRYGIAADSRVQGVAIILGSMEASLEEFPRALPAGASIHFEGEASARFSKVEMFVTSSAGGVRTFTFPSRNIDVNVRFDGKGVHRVELLAHGERGPEVLMNVPISVGSQSVARTSSSERAAPLTTQAEIEARVFELVNQARRANGAPPVTSDPELRAVALAHSEDMAVHHFHAHVSPTTGSISDRLRRAGVYASLAGENLARASSADAVHQGLMNSPAHRAGILDPRYTHMGIGIVVQQALGKPDLVATEIFARRPPPQSARQNVASVENAIDRFRASRHLPAARRDEGLRAAAEAAMRDFDGTDARRGDRASEAATRAIAVEVERSRRGRGAICIGFVELLELDELARTDLVMNPTIARYGIGVRVIEHPRTPRFALLLLAEGSASKPIKCN